MEDKKNILILGLLILAHLSKPSDGIIVKFSETPFIYHDEKTNELKWKTENP